MWSVAEAVGCGGEMMGHPGKPLHCIRCIANTDRQLWSSLAAKLNTAAAHGSLSTGSSAGHEPVLPSPASSVSATASSLRA